MGIPKRVIEKGTDIFVAGPMSKEEIVYQDERTHAILKQIAKLEKGANEMNNNENWSYEKDAPSFDSQFSAIHTFICTHVVANKEELMEKIRLLERSMKSVCDDYDKFRRTAKERTAVDYRLRSDAARATTPNRIWHNYGKDGKWYTTVEWKDGTKTTVGRTVDSKTWKDSYCGYTGFSCALAKKLYGSTTESTKTYMEAVDRVDEPKREKEQIRANQKWVAAVQREAAKRRREIQIREKMEEIRITNEAHSRMLTEFRQRETFVPGEE